MLRYYRTRFQIHRDAYKFVEDIKSKELDVLKDELKTENEPERIEQIKESIRSNGDNVNKYAVKFKLGKRKIYRANVNAQQVKVYKKLLDMLENRKVPKLSEQQATQ